MENKSLSVLFEQMAAGNVPDLWSVMAALNALPELVTLTTRPAGPAEPLTTCELNGRCNCGD